MLGRRMLRFVCVLWYVYLFEGEPRSEALGEFFSLSG